MPSLERPTTCTSCGAENPADEPFCWKCYTPFIAPEPEPAPQAAEPLPPEPPPPEPEETEEPPERFHWSEPRKFEPMPRPTNSRTAESATTFGPLGRMVVTAIVVAFNFFVPTFFLVLTLPGSLLILRQVWKPAVRY